MNAVLLTLTPFLPLTLALGLIPNPLRSRIVELVPLAPLPALAAAFMVSEAEGVHLNIVLLGLELGIDSPRRVLLGVTALIWLAAGLYVRGYIARDEKWYRFNALFCITMAGNLGLIIAMDVPGFYVFFSLMTLASYVLVVFDQTESAYRAGRIYIVLSLLGETCLLLGFMQAVNAAGSLSIGVIGPAIANEATHWPTLALLVCGFSIKAGLFPLHFWLPLAHPAAPTPASAVLSGAMIKAGLLGLLLFLPIGSAEAPITGSTIAALGIFTTFFAVVCGLYQSNPKTVLAYSSMSQMGVMLTALGVLLLAPVDTTGLAAAIIVYAAHHGLAKAALFFSIGLQPSKSANRLFALGAAGLCAFSIAGLFLTGGAFAKFALKETVALGPIGAWVVEIMPYSAVATTLLMLRFLLQLHDQFKSSLGKPTSPLRKLCWLPFIVTVACSQLVPVMLILDGTPAVFDSLTSVQGLLESTLPVAGGIALGVVGLRMPRTLRRIPSIPEGDIVALLPATERAKQIQKLLEAGASMAWGRTSHQVYGTVRQVFSACERADNALMRGNLQAAALILLAFGFALALWLA